MTNALCHSDMYEQEADGYSEQKPEEACPYNPTIDSETPSDGFHRRIVSIESSPAFRRLPQAVEGSPFVAVDRDVRYTLGDAYDEIRELSRNHHDRVVLLRDVSGMTVNQIRISGQNHAMSQIAAKSLCARLDLPYKYLCSLPERLQRVNFAYGLRQHRDREFFVSFNGDWVRGLFSTRYVPMDHVQILEALLRCGIPAGRRVQLGCPFK